MPEFVTTVINIVTLNSSGFREILNGNYDLVIIGIHARKDFYFFVHKSLTCDLKIFHVLSCMNCVCCSLNAVVSTL